MSEVKKAIFPEEILIAVLSRLGRGERIAEDQQFIDAFSSVAEEHDALRCFDKHPVYGDSPALAAALQSLDIGGGIVRENASPRYFRVSESVAGTYGRLKYDELEEDLRSIVDRIAERVSRDAGVA